MQAGHVGHACLLPRVVALLVASRWPPSGPSRWPWRTVPPAACTPRLIPRAGGGRPFNGDLHPLNGERELDPLVDACEVNDYPVLIPHGGDATAFRNGSAGAGGRVMAAEVLELGQMVDVAGRLDPADAYITNGYLLDAEGILFPVEGQHARAPTVADAVRDGCRVPREGGVGWLRLRRYEV